MYFAICAWIIGWVNNREAGELRRHRDHYDVIVMYWLDDVIKIAEKITPQFEVKENDGEPRSHLQIGVMFVMY